MLYEEEQVVDRANETANFELGLLVVKKAKGRFREPY